LQHLGLDWNPPKFKVLGVWFTNDLKNCENINYSEKFLEIKKLIQLWIKRCITPLGRIAILKSLILSKMIHLWLLLPNPPSDFLETLQLICYAFVWGDKQDKISRKTANKSTKDGGLGLPNLKCFVQALTLTWLRKFTSTKHKWKNFVLQNYSFMKTFESFGPNITIMQRGLNPFWTEVFDAYKCFYYKLDPRSVKELLAEPIYFNERFKMGKNTINHKPWFDKGAFCVGHFLNQNGDFMSHWEFTHKYDINVNFLTFQGCKQTIKTYVRKSAFEISDNNIDSKSVCMKRLSSASKGCKQFYDVLVHDAVRPNCCNKWEQKLGVIINWENCFYNVHKIKETKLKWFQMRIMHRIIGTNVVLKQIGVANNENCNMCDNVKDSIEHIFWNCVYAERFWTQFLNLVNEKCTNVFNMRFTKCLVLLGIDENIKIDETFYFIMLLAKQYLYKCKLDKHGPDVNVFRRVLLSRYKIEEFISRMDQTYHDFSTKWIMYKSLCAEQ